MTGVVAIERLGVEHVALSGARFLHCPLARCCCFHCPSVLVVAATAIIANTINQVFEATKCDWLHCDGLARMRVNVFHVNESAQNRDAGRPGSLCNVVLVIVIICKKKTLGFSIVCFNHNEINCCECSSDHFSNKFGNAMFTQAAVQQASFMRQRQQKNSSSSECNCSEPDFPQLFFY